MKKIIFILFFISFSAHIFAQKDLLAGATNTAALKKTLDSAMRPCFYITASQAEMILGQKVVLKDSTYRYSAGILRFSFNYLTAGRIDSTSKGRIFFSFEEFKDAEIARNTCQSIKAENEKSGTVVLLHDMGDEAFMQKDAREQPFIFVQKNNKIFKLRVYAVTGDQSGDAAIDVMKKIIAEK